LPAAKHPRKRRRIALAGAALDVCLTAEHREGLTVE
jgi:hypothetical protein